MTNKVPNWTYLAETSSTQTDVHERLATAKPTDIIAVQTERQHAGRGRLGRNWSQQADDDAIMFSVGFCLPNKPHELMPLPLLLGLSAVEVLHDLGFAEVGLKWPNDLMMFGKKCGGLLVEAHTNLMPDHTWFVAGLGINTASTPLLDDGRQAGCLAESVIGWHMNPKTVAKQLVATWADEWSQAWPCTDKANTAQRFQRLAVWLNEPITALAAGVPVQGTLVGVNDEGALIVRDAHQQHTITSGEVSRVRLAAD